MFQPVLKDSFAWRTQDPEYDWEMVGHLLLRDGEILLIDPPYVHGIEKLLPLIGKPQAIILTTADHTRGSKYLSAKLKVPIYVPLQSDSISVSPKKMYDGKGITNFEVYEEGTIFWLSARKVTVFRNNEDELPYIDEMILTYDRTVITGDIAMGSPSGELLTIDEGFTVSPDDNLVRSSFNVVKDRLSDLHIENLLSSHGFDIVGNLLAKLHKKETYGDSLGKRSS